MKRAELLRWLALAPLGALLTSCREGSTPVGTDDPETAPAALQDRALTICERIRQEGRADAAIRAEVERLVHDIETYRRRWGREDVAFQDGFGLDDIPESVQLTAGLVPVGQQPWGPGWIVMWTPGVSVCVRRDASRKVTTKV